MFEYFRNNYTWSLGVMGAINRGGQISEIDEACRPLREHAGTKALDGDPTARLVRKLDEARGTRGTAWPG